MSAGAAKRLALPIALGVVAAVVFVLALATIMRWTVTRRLTAERTTIAVTITSDRSPDANEAAIAIPLERRLTGVEGIVRMRIESRSGVVTASLTLQGNQALEGQGKLHDVLQSAKSELPADIGEPRITRLGRSAVPTFLFAPAAARSALERLQGVAGVQICGEKRERVHVVVDPARLAARGVELDDVVSALSSSPGLRTTPLLLEPEVDPQALARTPIGGRQAPVELGDLAVVERRPDESECALARGPDVREGDGVLLRVDAQPGVDITKARTEIASKAKEIGARMVDPASTVVVAFHAPASRGEGLGQAGWLASSGGPDTLAVTFDGEMLHVLRRCEPSDRDGSRAAEAVREARRPSGALPAYAGIVAAPAGEPRRLGVTLRGPELAALATRADAVRAKIGAVKGVGAFIGRPPASRGPTVEVTIDREAAARLGVHANAIARTVRAATGGAPVAGVIVHVGRRERDDDPPALAGILVNRVPLDRLVRVESRPALAPILRVDRERAVELLWEVDRDVAADVTKAIGDPAVAVEMDPSDR
ncbi:MAG: efflux RND transporter permease subunit [Deltaproteobacteria bacterium]|nr:efflux RND transporter permease subunit [Deltaproteobacteria bacterium]